MSADGRQSLPVKIGDRYYKTQLDAYSRVPLNQIAATLDTQEEPSERSFDNAGIWKRTCNNFLLGAGQKYFDDESSDTPRQISRRRFRWSRGFDVFSDTSGRTMQLLPDSEQKQSGLPTGGGVILPAYTASAAYLYIAAGGTVQRSGDDDDSTWTNVATGLGTVNSLVLIGDYVYIASGGTLRRVQVGSTADSTFGSLTPDRLVGAAGRLIGLEDNVIYEIDNTGAKSGDNIYEHFSTAFTWKGGVAAPNGIYVWGESPGTKSEIYLIPVSDANGSLVAPYPVGELSPGETLHALVEYGGVLVAGTSLGVRLFNISGSGFLTSGPVREFPSDVFGLAPWGDSVYFTLSDMQDADGTSAGFGLGRLFLPKFTDDLAPAYADDLFRAEPNRICRAAAFWQNKQYVMEDTGVSSELWGAHATNKVAAAEYRSGGITYSTPEFKSVSTVEGAWDALPAGASVEYEVSDGIDGTGVDCFTNNTTGSTREKAAPASRIYAEEIEVIIKATRPTDATAQVKIHRWTLRGIPMPFRSELIEIPIFLNPEVETESGKSKVKMQHPYDEFVYLKGLADSRELVTVEFGKETLTCYVDAIFVDNTKALQNLERWYHPTGPPEYPQGVWVVRLITEEPTG